MSRNSRSEPRSEAAVSAAFTDIHQVSPGDMVRALALLSKLPHASEKVQAYVTRSMFVYRKKIRQPWEDLSKVKANKGAFKLYTGFYLATSWEAVKKSFDVLCGTYRYRALCAAENCAPQPVSEPPVEVDDELKILLVTYIETIITSIILELNDAEGWKEEASRLARFPQAQLTFDFIGNAIELMQSLHTLTNGRQRYRDIINSTLAFQDTIYELPSTKTDF
ncbi:hypothetical protein CAOG_07932 [Capsaspora owczarzaki ATCC 30864]|uniref:hypothetical protein n=1 Tax=Capsaspora owczarzaki (strain ATCC 30864) TaxID=595528 RepID=UPI0001FE4B4A|nr:hypothetical protein CAOG_07932 [Capsaspora owczarzaki ATCC 30864]|eukprot:XP_004343017.1 hypothetical protein CAOG_07932 [Capsaspora owczarzaki ATCC 30864]